MRRRRIVVLQPQRRLRRQRGRQHLLPRLPGRLHRRRRRPKTARPSTGSGYGGRTTDTAVSNVVRDIAAEITDLGTDTQVTPEGYQDPLVETIPIGDLGPEILTTPIIEPRIIINADTAAEDARTATDAAAAGSSEARSPLGLVIGRTSNLLAPGAIGPDETALLDKLTPELGSPQANRHRNAGTLRAALNAGITEIRDASPGDSGGQFLNAERNLLQNRGWTFDPITNTWYAP
jgi:hypothetical protein